MNLPSWAVAGARLDGRAAARAGLYAMSANAVRFALNLTAAIMLARLLTPADFGLMGMITPVLSMALVFADGGVNFHTLQRKEIEAAEMTLTFWIGVGLAAATTAIFAALAPVLGWFYDEPAVTPVALAVSLFFVVQGLALQHTALCRRFMRQDLIFVTQIASAVLSLGFAVWLAFEGAGVWALVGLQFSRAVVSGAGLWIITGWVPGRPRRHRAFGEILGFGWKMVGARVAQVAGQGVDKVLLGWSYGAATLGYYQVAYQLMLQPIRQIQTPIAGIAVPYLMQRRDDPRAFMAAVAQVSAIIAVAMGPGMAVAGAIAEPLIVKVLGDQWRPSAPIFALFAIGVFFESARAPVNWSFLALGRPGLTAVWNVVCAVALIVSCVIALPYGPIGLAFGILLTQAMLLPASLVYAGLRTGHGYAIVLRALLIPALASAGCAVAARVLLAQMEGRSGWTILAASGGLWLVVTAVAGSLVLPGSWRRAFVARLLRRPR